MLQSVQGSLPQTAGTQHAGSTTLRKVSESEEPEYHWYCDTDGCPIIEIETVRAGVSQQPTSMVCVMCKSTMRLVVVAPEEGSSKNNNNK